MGIFSGSVLIVNVCSHMFVVSCCVGAVTFEFV